MDSFISPVFSAVLPVDTHALTIADSLYAQSTTTADSLTGGFVVLVTGGQAPQPPTPK